MHGGLGISFKYFPSTSVDTIGILRHSFFNYHRTPPYHDLSIPAPVVVQFKLYYRNDESVFSDPRPFTYMPVNGNIL